MTPHPDKLPPFQEAMRYDFPLTPESVIIEGGTYQGQWAEAMSIRHGCHIYTFEPIPEFYQLASARLKGHPKVIVSCCGLACENREEVWHIKGDMTGKFNGEGPAQPVMLIDFIGWLHMMELKLPYKIDLLALNCEGGEFALLECLILAKLHTRFRNIMVQPHGVVENAKERWEQIQQQLAETHELTFCAPFCWENWRAKL